MSSLKIGEGPIASPPLATTERTAVKPLEKANGDTPSAFAKVMTHLAKESDGHHKAMNDALKVNATTALDPATLLALQSDVYRYSQVVELSSKITEQVTQGIQTVLKSGGQ